MNGEPGRTRTCNPLLNPEILCSWLSKHFLASSITVFDGVRHGFVPKVVPKVVPKIVPAQLTPDDAGGTARGDFSYQIVASTFDRRISRSAVTNDRPSTNAVAPIKRSAGSLGSRQEAHHKCAKPSSL